MRDITCGLVVPVTVSSRSHSGLRKPNHPQRTTTWNWSAVTRYPSTFFFPYIMSSSSSRADPQSPTTCKRWEPAKIRRIIKDVQNCPKISLLTMLTALLARLLLDDKDTKASNSLHSEKVKQSKALIALMLRDAHTFCNDDNNVKATDLKRHLHD